MDILDLLFRESSADNDTLTSSFSILNSCISLDLINVLNTIVSNGDSRHLCLCPDFRGKALSFLPFNMMLLLGFS